MQPNNSQSSRKPSKAICYIHDNMSDQLNLQENTEDLMNLYLKKETTKCTSRLHTLVSYTLMALAGFQLSQELATNISWWHTIAMPMKSLMCPSSQASTSTVWSLYNNITQHLKDRNMLVNLQILDNEDSKEYKTIIKDKWNIKYQLVPSHIHHQNAAERAIRKLKAHFLSILSGVVDDFPCRHWYRLLPQWTLIITQVRSEERRV